ncbi:unnamed protein product, partial [Polarella glacialis]
VRKMQAFPNQVKLEYLMRHLDERCLGGLQALSRQDQETVAGQVDVTRCRNLSAFVWSQIRAAQSGGLQTVHPSSMGAAQPRSHQGARSRSPPGRRRPLSADLSSQSTEGLLEQMEILRRELEQRQAAAVPVRPMAPTRSGYQQAWIAPPSPGDEGAAFALRVGLDDGATQAIASLDAEGQRIAVALVEKMAARNPSAVTWSVVKRVRDQPLQAKTEFVRMSLDLEAGAAFDSLSPEEQESLLATVDLAKTRNVSASIWSRIRGDFPTAAFHASQARDQSRGMPRVVEPRILGHAPEPWGQSAQDWGQSAQDPAQAIWSSLDEKCRAALEALPQRVQQTILGEVPANCRNTSAYVWSKVKLNKSPPSVAAHASSAPAAPPANPRGRPTFVQAKVEAVDPMAVAGVQLDETCAVGLAQLPEAVQMAILLEVPADCRNPSAWVWSKVKAAKA